jgi:flavin-dependent dehydrogenase
MLMLGDAAGMITPLCGNGMAMAIHSAKLASELVTDFCRSKISRQALEKNYATTWNNQFAGRLWFGRQVQRLFGSEFASNISINLAVHSKFIAHQIIKRTHGTVFYA